MKPAFDALVLGASMNSLVAAARLAQKGLQVCLIAEESEPGGHLQTKELIPGYRFNLGSLDAGLFESSIIDVLGLSEDLEILHSPIEVLGPQERGPALKLWRDPEKQQENLAQFSLQDARKLTLWQAKSYDYAQFVEKMAGLAPPSLQYTSRSLLLKWARVAFGLRRMGGKQMMEFLRILPMSMARWTSENFENEALKGLLAAASLRDLMQGPRAAGTAFNYLYHLMGAQGTIYARSLRLAGGNQALVDALVRRCEALGVELKLGASQLKVPMEDYRAAGIEYGEAQFIGAKAVLSGMEARRTFFDHVGAQKLNPSFSRALRSYKLRGSTALLHFALSGLPDFHSASDESELTGRIVISPSLDYAEKAYDDAKYGRISGQPVLEMILPSLLDPSLAPEGHHTLTVLYRYAPYSLREGNWTEGKQELLQNTLQTLEHHAPGFSKLVKAEAVISPQDLERDYGLSEGSLSAGQMSLDQLLLMRPVPGFRGYQSPIDGLYLGSASAHPGGGNSGLPGWNAADQVLREM